MLAEVARATRALMFEEGDAEVLPLGHRVAPAESEFATLDPGETLVLGSTHVKRLTVGHLTSTEPVRRLGLGRDKNAVRIGCGVKKCVGGCRGGWAGIVSWGGACHSCGGATREDADETTTNKNDRFASWRGSRTSQRSRRGSGGTCGVAWTTTATTRTRFPPPS